MIQSCFLSPPHYARWDVKFAMVPARYMLHLKILPISPGSQRYQFVYDAIHLNVTKTLIMKMT
jgi:hypothetical protein